MKVLSEKTYEDIVYEAWRHYDSSRTILSVEDISAKVSTNHVFKLVMADDSFLIAKISLFGRFENFIEDHQIIQVLSNNLPIPYERFLARSLMKGNKLFVHRYTHPDIDAWVVFYLPLRIKERLPKILSEHDIVNLAKEFARFHKACATIRHTLPHTSKSMTDDLLDMLEKLNEDEILHEYSSKKGILVSNCETFLQNFNKLGAANLPKIPVFVDWNIGNFSLERGRFYSRWDYDWFRVASRILDFYFISRVVSDVGDRTVFTYNVAPLNGERFHFFLQTYHGIYPLERNEIYMIKEAYRFFLLHYVMHFGAHFFSPAFAQKLQGEVMNTHFGSIDDFDAEAIIKILKL